MSDIAEKLTNKIPNKVNSTLTMEGLTPILFGASAFQCLNAACELGLFELLFQNKKMKKAEIAKALKLQERAIDILLLGTTSLSLLKKEKEDYSNADVITQLFHDNLWKIFKDIVAFEQYIVYAGQVDLTKSLRNNTNAGLHHIPGKGRDLYHRLSENPKLEKIFYDHMNSWTKLTNHLLFKNADFASVNKVIDVGGGTGINAIALAKIYPHLQVTVLEIPGTAIITQKNIDAENLSDRVKVKSGDMFKDDYPKGHDCILFSHQLVIWTPEENISLLKRAYDALPKNGRVVIFNSVSNDEGTGPLMAALDSIYFAALPAEGGMIYAWHQYESWLHAAGFTKIQKHNCYGWTPHGVIEAIK